MRRLSRILALLLFFVCCEKLFSQNLVYYAVGENQLNNVDIYYVLEAKNGDVYVSSDNGLYKYSNGVFLKIPKPKSQKGNSLFSLVKTSSGDIFCSNLKGQVFRVHNNRLELFYTIPKETRPYFPYLLADKKNNLIVVSKQVDVFTSEGKRIDTITKFGFIDKNIKGEIIVGDFEKSFFLLDKKEKKYPLPFDSKTSKLYYQRCLLKRSLEKKSREKYRFKINADILIDKNNNSILTLDSTTFLVRLRNYGLQEIRREGSTFINGNTFLKKTFISSFTKGEDGTLYLGTFKQGLLIVPNYNFKAVKTAIQPRSIIDFSIRNDNEMYLNVREKGLLHYNNSSKKTTEVSKGYVNRTVISNANIEFQKTPLFSDVFIQTTDKNVGYGSVKDIVCIDTTAYIAATSLGLVFKGKSSLFKELKKERVIKSRAFFLTQINERCLSVEYHPKTQKVYVGTQNKLLSIANGTISEITYKGKSIIANSLAMVNDELLIGTQQEGVLKHYDDKTTVLYNSRNGLEGDLVKKIAVKGDYLFVLNTNFLQYINTRTQEIKPLNKSEGIIGYINKFHLSENNLWMLTDNTTITSIALTDLEKLDTKLHFKIDSLRVNNQVISLNKRSSFTYTKNNFNFFLSLKNDSYRDQTKIKYRLKGFDDFTNTTSAITKKITYKKLPPGTYTFSAHAQYGTIKSNPFTYTFTITPPFWRTVWFALLCVVAGLTFIISFFKYRMKKQAVKAREKLKQQQIQTDLVEAKLTALRSQMNPHFIFNALNSIQNLILKQDSEASYDYVVLFSKLVRNTLNYSEEEFITLEEEIDFLNIYLQLEKLRFGDDFTYKIDTLHSKDIEIPPLLIQPFLENALLHGLLSKKGEKNLHVCFSIEENQLVCTVTDNGIGRKKSAEIQKRQGKANKSFALNAIQKRLSILKQLHQGKIGYTFVDLYENTKSNGTKVIIILPYKE